MITEAAAPERLERQRAAIEPAIERTGRADIAGLRDRRGVEGRDDAALVRDTTGTPSAISSVVFGDYNKRSVASSPEPAASRRCLLLDGVPCSA